MNDDFQILFELLESRTQEVGGRGATAMSPELREKIAKFAAGTCTEEERDHMKKLLREKPDLIPVLAAETRALRPSNK